MARFNPDFWEVTLESAAWDRFAGEDGLWHVPAEESEERRRRERAVETLWPKVAAVADRVLTGRQREIVTLYYFREMNQQQIAARLGISQQSVSEHLYGKMRGGRRVGGVIRKLRRACAEMDLRWSP